jgi:DNA-binding CsgD family transcriptional regulator
MQVMGRATELAEGDAFLARAARELAVMLVDGEPGIGKTTVWRALVDQATREGRQVLAAQPAVSEAHLTLSTLADLLEGIDPAAIAALPDPRRRALEAALFRSGPVDAPLEPRLLGAAVRSLLADLAQTRPIVIAIDDVQWADPTSAEVLAFALRRLGGAPVALLAARRSGEPLPMDLRTIAPPEATTGIRVGPLSVAALGRVIEEHLGRPIPRSTIVRVHTVAGGAPLFAIEIARLLEEEGVPPAGMPLPVPPDVRQIVRRRVTRLPSRSREVLLAAAVDGHVAVDALATALGRPVARDLAVASRLEVAHVDGDRVVFAHPLFAAAITAVATDGERRRAHARMSRVATTAEARVRHRALAAPGPSASLAAELDAAAREAGDRGLPSVAVELVDLAIAATPAGDDAGRERRTLALAGFLERSGDVGRAQALLEPLLRSRDAILRARARIALATILYETEVPGSQLELCETAIAEAAADPAVAAHAHAVAALVSWDDFRRRERHVEAAMDLIASVDEPDPSILGLIYQVRCENDVASGRRLDEGIVAAALELEHRSVMSSVSNRFSAALGVWCKYEDDFEGARRWLEQTLAAAVDEGDEGSLPYALSHFPELELWTGRWDAAEAAARRHLELATAAGLEAQRRQAVYNLCLVLVHRGEEGEARPRLEAGLAEARADGDAWTEASLLSLLGHLELSLGDGPAAVISLRRATALRDAAGQVAPRRFDSDLVEGLVASGELEEASTVLGAAVDRATRFGRHSALANTARARAVVAGASGDLDGAIAALDAALAEHARAPIAFDRARTLLALGQVHRRRRERTAARTALEEAVATFDGLGARLWAARGRAELDRLGLRRRSATELTDGERRTAELAASGLTNREVAAAMFVSAKTVEANLARAYRKLGVRSRAELGALMGGAETHPRRTADPGPALDS